jgi:Tol biopolymer transport system component
MKPSRSRALLGTTIAMGVAAIGFAGNAHANSLLPGLNGKIAFTSARDFPFLPDAPIRGFQSCQSDTSDNDCALEIYSMNADGSAQTRLTNNTAGDDEAAWLPADGANIAFESDRASTPCNEKLLVQIGCPYDIWSMGNDGSNPTQLTTDLGDEGHASYSPDGTRIAFSGQNPDLEPSPDRLAILTGESEIFTMPAGGESGSAPTPLLPAGQTGLLGPMSAAFDSFPTYSPDGSKIAFTRLTIAETVVPPPSGGVKGGQQIESFTFDIRTYVAPSSGTGPATPIETYPVCTVTEAAPASVTAVQALARAVSTSDTSRVRSALQSRELFLPGCTYDFKPAWSPDGSKLAVWRASSTVPPQPATATRGSFATFDLGDIAVFNAADGSGDTDLSDLSEPSNCGMDSEDSPECSEDTSPAWSPDGTKIAFDSDRQADGTASTDCIDEATDLPNGNCDSEIWTMNADGSGLTQLTNNAFDDLNPDWQRIPPPPPPPAAPAAPTTPPKVGVAGVRRACVSSAFHVRFHIATTATSVKSVVVKLDGRKIKSTTKSSFTLTINSRKLRAGRHRLTITATDSAGHVTTTHKSFSVCKAAKPRRKSAPRFTG